MEANNIYHFIYVDSSRKESERDFTLDRIKFSGGKLYLFGFCHLRESFREFSVAGIKKLLKDNVEIENIEEYFLDLYFQSDDGKELMKYKGFKFLFDFLWIAAKTCTPIEKEEKEIMNEFLEKEENVLKMLKTVFDPEIPVNVYDLGLIYNIDIKDDNSCTIDMTLTAPSCPAADFLVEDIEQKVASVEGISSVKVNIVYEPEWTKDMMSEEAKLELGFL